MIRGMDLGPKALRKSWDGNVDLKIKERLSTKAVEHEMKLLPHCASGSPDRLAGSDHCVPKLNNSNYMEKIKRDTERASRVVSSSTKHKLPLSNRTCGECSNTAMPSRAVNGTAANDRRWIENNVSWSTVPSSLVKVGKEVLRHRDAALIAAVEALQEASAAERLIRCLSTFTELQYSNKEDNPQLTVEQFLNLHDDLVQAQLIVQSLAKTSPLRPPDSKPLGPDSIKRAVKVSTETKKCAASWIKAAVASDLSPYPLPSKLAVNPAEPTAQLKSAITCITKPKGIVAVNKHRKSDKLEIERYVLKENTPMWVPWSGTLEAAELAQILQGESRSWFLNYVEKFLDGIKRKKIYTASECQVAGILCLVKRVDDWLDEIRREEGDLSEDDETRACRRVREKIYGVLLNHVESAAVALGNMSTNSAEHDLEGKA